MAEIREDLKKMEEDMQEINFNDINFQIECDQTNKGKKSARKTNKILIDQCKVLDEEDDEAENITIG